MCFLLDWHDENNVPKEQIPMISTIHITNHCSFSSSHYNRGCVGFQEQMMEATSAEHKSFGGLITAVTSLNKS